MYLLALLHVHKCIYNRLWFSLCAVYHAGVPVHKDAHGSWPTGKVHVMMCVGTVRVVCAVNSSRIVVIVQYVALMTTV